MVVAAVVVVVMVMVVVVIVIVIWPRALICFYFTNVPEFVFVFMKCVNYVFVCIHQFKLFSFIIIYTVSLIQILVFIIMIFSLYVICLTFLFSGNILFHYIDFNLYVIFLTFFFPG